MLFKEKNFVVATPIWQKGKRTALNHALLFETEIERKDDMLLRVSEYIGYQMMMSLP